MLAYVTQVDPDNHWFYDADGRVVLFHGVNSVYKGFPWYWDYLFDDTRLDDLADFGLNVVRLGSMWTGAEPVEGVWNETYIGENTRCPTERQFYMKIYVVFLSHLRHLG